MMGRSIAVAIPAGNEAPVVLDIATSLASNGAIRTHELEGRPTERDGCRSHESGGPHDDLPGLTLLPSMRKVP